MKKKLKWLGLMLWILLMPFVLPAEEIQEKKDPLTLDQCIEFALRQHPAIVAARKTLSVNQSRIGQAQSDYYPQLSSSSGYNRYWDTTRHDVYSTSLILSQNIYDFGRTQSRTAIQQHYLESAVLDLENVIRQTLFGVKKAYYGVLAAEQSRDAAKETVSQFDQHLKQANAFYQAGRRARYEVTRAEVDLSNARLALIKAENVLKLARVSLDTALGGESEVAARGIEDHLKLSPYAFVFEKAQEKAYQERADLNSLLFRKKALEESLALAQKGFYPTFSGNAAYTYAGDDRTSQTRDEWKLGATLTIPIFSGFLTKYQIDEAKANLKVLAANEEGLRQTIFQEIQQGYLNLKEAEERISHTELAIRQAKENLDLANGRYATGVGSPMEVTDAEVSLNNAKLAHIQALYDWKMAQAEIEKALGGSVQ